MTTCPSVNPRVVFYRQLYFLIYFFFFLGGGGGEGGGGGGARLGLVRVTMYLVPVLCNPFV